jgi:hypothetical protein
MAEGRLVMPLTGSGTATALLAAALMSGMGSWPSYLCPSTVFAHSPAAKISAVQRLPPDAARVYAAIKTAHPGEFKWQQIPWLLDLEEGIRLAKKENRPLLLFVSGDEPLERC